MQVKPRAFALEELLRPLEIDYRFKRDTLLRRAWRRRGEVELVYPFMTDEERKAADNWFRYYDEKMLAIVE